MKFLKKVLILIISLICLVLIIALFVKKDFHVSRSVEISATNDEVFEYLRFMGNHSEFSVWEKMDPNVKQSINGEDGKVGAIYTWDSKMEDLGAGEQEIIKIEDGKRIDYELRFKRPWEVTSNAYFAQEELGAEKIKVSWGITGSTSYPWNFLSLFMDMDAEMGPDLKKGLDDLKKILESEE